MTRWQVELTGHEFDVEELPRLLTAPALRVVEDDGHYLLEAEVFESLTEGVAVHAAARELLPRINGVAKLKNRSFRNVDIGHVHELDNQGKKRQHVVLLVDTVEARSKASAVIGRIGDDELATPEPGSLETDEWMRGAGTEPHAARALELWGGPHDPSSLWKVWELIRQHSGLGIEEDLVRRFRPSVNDKSIAGEDARHEVPPRRHRVDVDTMTVPEAEAFLGDLLAAWLASSTIPGAR